MAAGRCRIMSSSTKGPILPSSHPCLATVWIDVEDWCRFRQLTEDAVELRVLGREPGGGGVLRVDVACSDDVVRDKIEDAWS